SPDLAAQPWRDPQSFILRLRTGTRQSKTAGNFGTAFAIFGDVSIEPSSGRTNPGKCMGARPFASSEERIVMRTLPIGLLIGAIAVLGCTRESPKGGGPADKKVTTTTSKDGATTTTTKTTEDRDKEFSVKVPSGATNVTQGKQK